MKKQRISALLLTVCLLLGLCACGNRTGGAYTLIATLSQGSYGIGFRNDDPAADYVEAALKVLNESGQIREIDIRWFGDAVTAFESDATALDKLDAPAPRQFIMGLDADNFPMSYKSGDRYAGFDVELAEKVCALLGWELRFHEIGDESDAYVELSSGNVDCIWGGMMLDPSESTFRVICPYMEADISVIVLAGSHLGSLRKLSDKTIGMNDGQKYADAVANSELTGSTAEIKTVSIGNDQLFDGLVKGTYDAIITDRAAARYYMR